jgi:hypothetical protein
LKSARTVVFVARFQRRRINGPLESGLFIFRQKEVKRNEEDFSDCAGGGLCGLLWSGLPDINQYRFGRTLQHFLRRLQMPSQCGLQMQR